MDENLIIPFQEEETIIIDVKVDTNNVPKRIRIEYELTTNNENISKKIED